VDDLTGKSKGQATPAAITPAQEIANPFVQPSNSLQAAVSALIDSDAVNKVKAQVPDRLQNRLFRKPSRSSSRHGELERTKWHIELNQHCNGGLRNAVNSLSDRLRRKLWVGVLGTPTDKVGNDLRDDVDFKMRKEAQCLPVWIPDAEFSKCYDEFCHRVLWPLLHYTIPDAPRTKSFYETESWSHYIAVNQKFADAIVENYEEGDICACCLSLNNCWKYQSSSLQCGSMIIILCSFRR